MALSKTARIWTLLVIDTVFLLIELIVGYAVGSLALVADAFHMLNDVLSLVVALYAIKVSGNSPNSSYSYGWHRAEILAALVNGVFLLALCFSISLEAIQRFFTVPEISNPKLVVIVGSLGLASNIVGLFLFHEHDHSHGDDHDHPESPSKLIDDIPSPNLTQQGDENTPLLRHVRGNSANVDIEALPIMYGHPAQTRAQLYQAAERAGYDRSNTVLSPTRASWKGPNYVNESAKTFPTTPVPTDSVAVQIGNSDDDERTSVTASPVNYQGPYGAKPSNEPSHDEHSHKHGDDDHDEHSHAHQHPKSRGAASGHSHGNMNMRALLLHVLGDALGNVGVISSGLIIWLTTWPGRYYSDPIISLIITVIIFSSALPLVKSASFILLQGVPTSIDLDSLREDIRRVRGVKSIHELHVWQLSESKIIGSVHVCVEKNVEYMKVAKDIREVLHEHGVHSCAIQPEFEHELDGATLTPSPGKGRAPIHEVVFDGDYCLLPCAPDGTPCPPQATCCPTPTRPRSEHS